MALECCQYECLYRGYGNGAGHDRVLVAPSWPPRVLLDRMAIEEPVLKQATRHGGIDHDWPRQNTQQNFQCGQRPRTRPPKSEFRVCSVALPAQLRCSVSATSYKLKAPGYRDSTLLSRDSRTVRVSKSTRPSSELGSQSATELNGHSLRIAGQATSSELGRVLFIQGPGPAEQS